MCAAEGRESLVSAKDQTAAHYLRIYRLKLAMAQDGTTSPSVEGIELFRDLVEALETLDTGALVRLEATPGVARFTVAHSGLLLAELPIGDDLNIQR
jgi:hypothetical protein